MDIRPVGSEAAIGESDGPTEYRVRIWSPATIEGYSWMVDEWDVRDAPDVVAAIGWAEAKAAGRPVEIFVKWMERALPRDGGPEDVPRMTRVYGTPGDNNPTTETIVFETGRTSTS